MTQGLYHYLRAAWKKPNAKDLRERMILWRNEGSVVKVEKPLRLDRARALGYKAKKGIIVARVKVVRGGHYRARPNKGRRSKRMTINKNLKVNYQWIAEQRAQKSFHNLEVLNSYQIGRDGVHYFYEVILVDPKQPEIAGDRTLKWIAKPEHKKRVLRGKTSAGRRARGLRNKSPTAKVRPSVRSNRAKGK